LYGSAVSEAGSRVALVRSADGTPVACHRTGAGPPLVLVHGTTGAHWSFRLVEPLLAEEFTVHAIDRRGRGESGDAETYAIEREFEDVAAVVDSIGESADVFAHSSGATVALGAALLARGLRRLVLYEPSPGLAVIEAGELDEVDELVGRGEREEALVRALRSFGLTPDEVQQLRASPTWEARVGFVHTVAREARAEEACRLTAEQLRGLTSPILFLLGEESPAWAAEATEQLRSAVPDGRVVILPGQGHAATVTAPELLAREVGAFLREPSL
jgi:pimeloyl-ACP methyl ester carboxylesterase